HNLERLRAVGSAGREHPDLTRIRAWTEIRRINGDCEVGGRLSPSGANTQPVACAHRHGRENQRLTRTIHPKRATGWRRLTLGEVESDRLLRQSEVWRSSRRHVKKHIDFRGRKREKGSLD